MSKRILSGSIALSKLVHVKMEVDGKKGKVPGIFIPTANNHLVIGKEGALYLPVSVIVRNEADQYGQHGFIAQSVDSKVWKASTDEQKEVFKKLPVMGNIKDFSGDSNDNTGAASEETYTPGDGKDLPF